MEHTPLLSIITFLPLLGALAVILMPRENKSGIKGVAFGVSVITFLASLPLFFLFDVANARYFQFTQFVEWIPSLGIHYSMGLDGISLFLVLLTTLISPIAIAGSFTAIKTRLKEYMLVMLLLETTMLGVFCATDLVLFYIFFEAMLIPMYLLIGIWGGERRIYATIKFFIYTMVGSLLMLIAIIALYTQYQGAGLINLLPETDPHRLHTFYVEHFHHIVGQLREVGATAPASFGGWCFLAFAIAFAIKVPLFPFHTWLPDAHVEAPTAGSVILAGILLKIGTYGFLRFNLPFFPEASLVFAPWICWLAVIGIIYGALVAMVQPDVKKLVAYSSVSHLGFVMLGLFSFNQLMINSGQIPVQGMMGGMMQMINHGLSTGALFLLVGMIYERRHTRLIADYGGVLKVMPWFGTIFLIITLSSIGLPGLNGFIGEFLVLMGSMKNSFWFTFFAATGVILAAIYMLWMYQRVFLGDTKNPENQKLTDITPREKWILVPILIFCVWIGVYPSPFTRRIEPALTRTAEILMEAHGAERHRSMESEPQLTQQEDHAVAEEDESTEGGHGR